MNTCRSACKSLIDLYILSIWMPSHSSFSQCSQSIYEGTLIRHSWEKSTQGKQQEVRKWQPKNHSCMPQDNTKKQQTCQIAGPCRTKAYSQQFCKMLPAQQASEQLETLRLAEPGNFKKLHKGYIIFLRTKPRNLTFLWNYINVEIATSCFQLMIKRHSNEEKKTQQLHLNSVGNEHLWT